VQTVAAQPLIYSGEVLEGVKERYGPARELSEGLYIDVAVLEKLVFPLDRRDLVRS
jgi:hypothetical protein